jgi:hypothetical protein
MTYAVRVTRVQLMQLFDHPAQFAAAPDVFPPDKFNAGSAPKST